MKEHSGVDIRNSRTVLPHVVALIPKISVLHNSECRPSLTQTDTIDGLRILPLQTYTLSHLREEWLLGILWLGTPIFCSFLWTEGSCITAWNCFKPLSSCCPSPILEMQSKGDHMPEKYRARLNMRHILGILEFAKTCFECNRLSPPRSAVF